MALQINSSNSAAQQPNSLSVLTPLVLIQIQQEGQKDKAKPKAIKMTRRGTDGPTRPLVCKKATPSEPISCYVEKVR